MLHNYKYPHDLNISRSDIQRIYTKDQFQLSTINSHLLGETTNWKLYIVVYTMLLPKDRPADEYTSQVT